MVLADPAYVMSNRYEVSHVESQNPHTFCPFPTKRVELYRSLLTSLLLEPFA